MRIGILTRNYPPMHGGMARHAVGLARALATNSEVVLYAPPAARESDGRIALMNTLDTNVANNTALVANADVDVWLALSAQFAPLAKTSVAPFVLFFHGNDFLHPIFNPGYSLASRLGHVPVLWRFLPRLLHAVGEIPLIRTIAVDRQRRILAKSLRNAGLVLFNSTYTRELAKTIYDFDDIPTEVLYPGCDEMFFQARRPADNRVLRLLTVANLSVSNRRKNIDGVLDALSLIVDDVMYVYTVIGDGDDRQRLRRKARDLGIGERVRFLGKVDDAALLTTYAESDLFILTPKASEYDVEGFGMVYIEANAAGLPVIASARGGALDAVVDGRTGIVLQDSSPGTIANAIRLFHSGALSVDENEARRHASTFRWCRIAERFNALLKAHLQILS